MRGGGEEKEVGKGGGEEGKEEEEEVLIRIHTLKGFSCVTGTWYFIMLSSMIAARAQEGNTMISLPVSKMENLTPEETGSSKVSCRSVPYGTPLKDSLHSMPPKTGGNGAMQPATRTDIIQEQSLGFWVVNPLACVSPC